MIKSNLLPLHRLYYLFSGINPQEALNYLSDETPTSGDDVAFELKQTINFLKHDAFNPNTREINYTHLQNSEAYHNYRRTTEKLHLFSLDSLQTREQKLAFWINMYNVLIVDAVIHYGIEKTVREVKGFFARAAYIIDKYRFSSDDIEHGILRANAGHVAIPGPQFGAHDPRRQFMLEERDPRIHFTLVCASQSCPPIGVYNASRIDAQLDTAAYNFINGGEVTIDLDNRTAHLSRIFQWYSLDFGGTALNQSGLGKHIAALQYVAQYIDDEPTKSALLNDPDAFQVHFKEYNWGLNLTAAGRPAF